MTIDIPTTQTNLTKLGYYTGGVDGVFGKNTMLGILRIATEGKITSPMPEIAKFMAELLPASGILSDPRQLAEFVAQTAHETGGYVRFSEGMRFTSAERICKIWPKRFPTLESAKPFVWDGNPEDGDEDRILGNKVYGGRMGNELNGLDDDDGFNRRGGGLIQHTGAAEYERLLNECGITSDQIRTDPKSMVVGAITFWQKAKVMPFVAKNDDKGARRAVNGGYIGLEEIADIRTSILKTVV
jgi:putative chitinase